MFVHVIYTYLDIYQRFPSHLPIDSSTHLTEKATTTSKQSEILD